MDDKEDREMLVRIDERVKTVFNKMDDFELLFTNEVVDGYYFFYGGSYLFIRTRYDVNGKYQLEQRRTRKGSVTRRN